MRLSHTVPSVVFVLTVSANSTTGTRTSAVLVLVVV